MNMQKLGTVSKARKGLELQNKSITYMRQNIHYAYLRISCFY